MTRRKDQRKIKVGRFRRRRFYLADHVFAIVIKGNRADEHRNPLRKKRWRQMMDLPTDVALRTTDQMGSLIEDMQRQWWALMNAMPSDPDEWPFISDAYLDVLDEFDAAPFIAVHGYYRQATAALRGAFEVMTHACRYAVANDQSGFTSWRKNENQPPKFGNSVDIIGLKSAGKAIDERLGGQGLFCRPDGVMRALHRDLCRYVHNTPGFSNGDIWQSNGPIFVPEAFTQFWLDYCDTSLASIALLKIAFPAAHGDRMFKAIASTAGSPWHGLAPATVKVLNLADR